MTWVRIDDGFADHPKILALGPEGIAAQLRALCYCARHLTNGFIPTPVAQQIVSDLTSVTQSDMVKQKLWQNSPGGYRVHDYLKYNPDRKSTLKLRRTRKESGRRGGLAKGVADRQARALANASPRASHVAMPPSRPLTTTTSKKTRSENVAQATSEEPRNGLAHIGFSLKSTLEAIQTRHPELGETH